MINLTIRRVDWKLILAVLIIAFWSNSMAATYFVKPSGNDNNNGLSDAQAWQHVQKACATLVAGDTVFIRAGRYAENSPSMGGDGQCNAGLRPAHSGTPGNPIVFKGYPGEMPIIQGVPYGWGSPRAGAWLDDLNYITLDSLYFNRGWAGINVQACTGITIKYCKIDSCISNYDNAAGIGNDIGGNVSPGDDTYDLIIDHCEISYISKSSDFKDESQTGGIELYTAFNVEITNNIIHHCSDGIYLKGGNPHETGAGHPVTISGNTIYDCFYLCMYLGNGGKWANVSVYNNVMYSTGAYGSGDFGGAGGLMGLAFPSSYSGVDALQYAWIYNNTFDCTGGFPGIRSQDGNIDSISIFNNVFYNPPLNAGTGEYRAAIGIDNQSENPARFYEDYNMFYGRGDHTYYVYPSNSDFTISEWVATNRTGLISGHGTHSIEADPLFTNRSARDYSFQTGSPALTSGRGGAWPSYMGASGTDSSQPDDIPPNAINDLRVNTGGK